MSASDTDLELLDAYLDGELSAAEVEELRVRLDVDPDLAAALEALRSQRRARQSAWRSMEPPDADADRFADRLVASVASASRHERFNAVLAKLKLVTAAAACIAIGFSVGWLGRGGEMGALRTGVATTPQQALTAPIGSGGSGLAVRQPQAGGPVEITLTDGAGQVLATQEFESPQQAREFINDLDAWQRQHERLRDAQLIYTGGQF